MLWLSGCVQAGAAAAALQPQHAMERLHASRGLCAPAARTGTGTHLLTGRLRAWWLLWRLWWPTSIWRLRGCVPRACIRWQSSRWWLRREPIWKRAPGDATADAGTRTVCRRLAVPQAGRLCATRARPALVTTANASATRSRVHEWPVCAAPHVQLPAFSSFVCVSNPVVMCCGALQAPWLWPAFVAC